jgi:zinc metalloprotease ZmpB
VYQELNKAHNVLVNRDDKGIARELLHAEEPFVTQAPTAQLAAAEYLSKYGDLLGIKSGETNNLSISREAAMTPAESELRFDSEKKLFDTTTVTYQQTYFGLPVWHGGVSVHLKDEPVGAITALSADDADEEMHRQAEPAFKVINSQSTRHADLDLKQPSQKAIDKLKKISKTTLAKQLGLSAKQEDFDLKTLAIDNLQLIIYRYVEARRVLPEEPPVAPGFAGHHSTTLPLPPVAKGIEEGKHYVSAEVNFSLSRHGQSELHWVAIIEVEPLSVLYLRAFIDHVSGLVFQNEPMTDNGGPLPNSTSANLNAVRTSIVLPGLAAPSGGVQSLIGNLIKMADVELPTPLAAPTRPSGTSFNFDARTNEFAGVNAYYHCDSFFRLMQSMGFNLASYFSSAQFPTIVDHRGLGSTASPSGNLINAHCVGSAGGLGILQTTFALADTSDVAHPIGIACDYRVVLHELAGHGVLYPHVHSPNFGFSHSAGDSVAAITCDPNTHAPDRFVTFPWVNIGRRHDRAVSAGWGWSGNIAMHPFSTLDPGGYNNEQILSTTLFRFYRAIRGDSPRLAERQFAARYTVYLILRAIGMLTPATNPSSAAGFATVMINADLGDWTTEGHAGGAYGKVIRWAFEKQGLYQPAGTPTPNNNIGAPPAVDVYIEDGRHGEYQYNENHWSCQAIWNRRKNDGGTAHEDPVLNKTNYAYVKIKNRGTQVATDVVVKAYHADPAAGLRYPNDWKPMTTVQLPAANVPPNNSAEITVGPFKWIPTYKGHECLFMVVSATGDPSNVSNMTAGDSIPEWRLVPYDNNIGQRNIVPVASATGFTGLAESMSGMTFEVKNPNNGPARMIVKAKLPSFMSKAGWNVTFANPGAGAFTLNAGEAKTVVLNLNPGSQPIAEVAIKAKAAIIEVKTFANGILVGGMSYQLDPQLFAAAK